jgi:Co/Zn/Cd efflux system component
MSASCHHDHCTADTAPLSGPAAVRWRRILWIALIVNATMFVVELLAGLESNSVSLLADAIDFAGDAANYGLSLAVLSMALVWRSRAALLKGATMLLYGLFVLARAGWIVHTGSVPDPLTMGVIGFVALLANTGVAVLLFTYRNGDANMRSVWLCSRNDAISNVAVMLAGLGVFGTGSAWPDLVVAAVMASLAITAGLAVVRQAMAELKQVPGHASDPAH